jgi:hypothetical protein
MSSAVGIVAVIIVGAASHPPRMGMRRAAPITRHPDITAAPIVEAVDPHIARSRCVTDYAHDWRWRRSGHIVAGTNRTTGKKKHREGRY